MGMGLGRDVNEGGCDGGIFGLDLFRMVHVVSPLKVKLYLMDRIVVYSLSILVNHRVAFQIVIKKRRVFMLVLGGGSVVGCGWWVRPLPTSSTSVDLRNSPRLSTRVD